MRVPAQEFWPHNIVRTVRNDVSTSPQKSFRVLALSPHYLEASLDCGDKSSEKASDDVPPAQTSSL